MVSAQTNNDTGYHQNLGIGDDVDDESFNWKLFQNGDFIIPVGKAVNLHVQIFSNTIQQYYGRCWPDIFASYCSESVFSFVCAAIKQKWVISKDVIAHHVRVTHSNSAGFSPLHWTLQGKPTYDHPFLVPSVLDIMTEGWKYGLGYEECKQVIMHDPQHYNDHGYCNNDSLKEYIKNNLFLPASLLDYTKIKYTWITQINS